MKGITTALGAAAIALAALTIGSAPQALAAPGDNGCSSMAMPTGTGNAGAPDPMTRAGQIATATAPRADGGGDDPMTCQQVSHG